jgi:hypothetical protein
MKRRRLKLLFLFIICFFMLKGLVHSSTDDHSFAARTNSAFEKSNFTRATEPGEIVVDSDQYELQVANNSFKASPALTRENSIVEGPSNLEMEIEGGQKSGPGVATFILFCVVIAWITTAGGPKEN